MQLFWSHIIYLYFVTGEVCPGASIAAKVPGPSLAWLLMIHPIYNGAQHIAEQIKC